MTNLHKRILPDLRIEPVTAHPIELSHQAEPWPSANTDQTAKLYRLIWVLTCSTCEPPHDKTNKMACVPSEKLRSAWASAQSDQSLRCALKWVAKDPRFLHAESEDSDQTGRMPRLIWVFAGCTCHFAMRWLMSFCRFYCALAPVKHTLYQEQCSNLWRVTKKWKKLLSRKAKNQHVTLHQLNSPFAFSLFWKCKNALKMYLCKFDFSISNIYFNFSNSIIICARFWLFKLYLFKLDFLNSILYLCNFFFCNSIKYLRKFDFSNSNIYLMQVRLFQFKYVSARVQLFQPKHVSVQVLSFPFNHVFVQVRTCILYKSDISNSIIHHICATKICTCARLTFLTQSCIFASLTFPTQSCIYASFTNWVCTCSNFRTQNTWIIFRPRMWPRMNSVQLWPFQPKHKSVQVKLFQPKHISVQVWLFQPKHISVQVWLFHFKHVFSRKDKEGIWW